MESKPILYIVVPCYNEEEVIEWSVGQLDNKLNQLISDDIVNEKSKLLFVNDGSADRTAEMLTAFSKENDKICLINFLKNEGHQSAILAGMLTAGEYADIVITIDADLQQDIDAMENFIEEYKKGNEVVYGVRNDRKTDGFFKKFTAKFFYRLMKMMGSKTIPNSADYRLMSKKAIKALSMYQETNLFLRGLIPMMGFKSSIVYFDVKERTAGKSKYTFKKMMSLAMNGITSFSITPIRMISFFGVIFIIISIAIIIYSIVCFCMDKNVPGYTTEVVSQWFIGGALMFSMGILGEYIGKIYSETKKRPRYIIDTAILPEKEEKEDE